MCNPCRCSGVESHMKKVANLYDVVDDRLPSPWFEESFKFLFVEPAHGALERHGEDIFYSGGEVGGHFDTRVPGKCNAFCVLSCTAGTLFHVGDDEMWLSPGDVVVFDPGVFHGVTGGGWPFVVMIHEVPVDMPESDVVKGFVARL